MEMAASSPTKPKSAPLAGSMNWDPLQKRLLGDDFEDSLAAATELRQGIEIVHSTEFPLMLSALLPSLSTVLTNRTLPSPDTSSTQHKLRNTVLDIISKFPLNDVLRPHAPHLVAVARDVLTRDYEDNAVLASRIIFDLYKVYRNLPQDDVQPFMDFVVEVYRSLPIAVSQNFSFDSLSMAQSPAPASKNQNNLQTKQSTLNEKKIEGGTTDKSGGAKKDAFTPPTKQSSFLSSTSSVASLETTQTPPKRVTLRSNASFRVLTECPLIVMLMFQLYPKFVKTNIPSMIGAMMSALALRPSRLDSLAQGSTSSTQNMLTPAIRRLYYDRYRELIAAQAKTLSFLTYLLRGFSSDLKPYEDKIAANVVALMANCPRESVSTRKELLVATRHLLSAQDFRSGFHSHIDALLDERILMGSQHRFSDQTLLRPLAYTTLSDLVQHFRPKMSMAQISRVVLIFSRVLHETSSTFPGMPISTEYAAVRTLFSVVEIVHRSKDASPNSGRRILVRILKTLVDKLYSLVDSFPSVVKPKKGNDGVLDVVAKQSNLSSHNDSIREVQSMVRAIVVNLKTVINYISTIRSHDKADELHSKSAAKSTSHEVEILERYIRIIFPAAKILKEKIPSNDDGLSEKAATDQYRDALTYFAASFQRFDRTSLRQTLGRNLDFLVDAVIEDPVAMVIPRHLLSCNPTTSFEVSSILLGYLLGRMEELSVRPDGDSIAFLFSSSELGESLGTAEETKVDLAFAPSDQSFEFRSKRSSALLLLFERVLKSLAAFQNNEYTVRKFLRRMVVLAFRSAMENTANWPDSNCMLLRYIFRSISAGKFEESYKELLPLIPSVLNGLYRVLCASSDTVITHTAIELCLTIPARLSSLLPHLNLLLRIIIPALDSDSGDLVNLGLRTLEFWVDNLNQKFLYPEISKQANLLSSLTQSLSRHLRPAPYPYGLLTLRLLGKLGGKNRQVLRDNFPLVKPTSCEELLPLHAACTWKDTNATPGGPVEGFKLPLPLHRSVSLLERLALSEPPVEGQVAAHFYTVSITPAPTKKLTWAEKNKLWDCNLEEVDFEAYSLDVMSKTKSSQASAALEVIKAAANQIVGAKGKIRERNELSFSVSLSRAAQKKVFEGFLFAACMDVTNERALRNLKSFKGHIRAEVAADASSEFLSKVPDSKADHALAAMTEIFDVKTDGDASTFDSLLLRSLCGCCSTHSWGKQIASMRVLISLMDRHRMTWCRNHEIDLVIAAFLSVKTAPREISLAAAKASEFFLQVCVLLYGAKWNEGGSDNSRLISDPLCTINGPSPATAEKDSGKGPGDEALRIVLQELVSPCQLVRICSRFFIKHFVLPSRGAKALSDQSSTVRRLLFSRHLRLLPLPHQVGLIEALGFLLSEVPGFFPLSDQHMLNFLSELLKMCSVADGEMVDKALGGLVVDKNGYAAGHAADRNIFPTHAFALFFRRKIVLRVPGAKIIIPEELPPGVQLRVSSITLIHAVVSGGSNVFFDAEPSTSIGNIRPHMISLLFRSLVSSPAEAVIASHNALRDVLSLSAKPGAQGDTAKAHSRLPKELLQTCIRPVLLNLRDYTRLTIPLLRGLSKLLSLLSTWFNKTLGEKLLDHLQKWTDPQHITKLRAWKEGEEPLVASAIVEVFWLLPQASKFVEQVVNICLDIEAVLPSYKMKQTQSPFRTPLARFLNKNPQQTIDFFFKKLTSPPHSDLFQSIISRPECTHLRKCLSQKPSSIVMLNVCFERPLAIMRSEKSGNSPSSRASLALHGIGAPDTDPKGPPWPMTVDSHEVQLQGLRTLTTLLKFDKSYFEDHGDIVRAMRLLWRSRGRFLRLQNEEQVLPRYHEESRSMSSFLMDYATYIAGRDIDGFVEVMQELLCIFLQAVTANFGGLKTFLASKPLLLLSEDKQKYFANRILKRLSSEKNEETKVLSVQLLLLPLLTDLRRTKRLSYVIDPPMVDMFVQEILFNGGSPAPCGDRLRVEFLQLLSVLVDGTPDFLRGHNKDLMRYCSSLLKSEDIACTSWSYIVICQLSKAFGVSLKTNRQVYSALLRSHHQEGKELVRAALDILMPSFHELIPNDSLPLIADQTAQIMLEESNSTPQLAHICLTILVGRKNIFFKYRDQFASLMVGTLNRLGLSSGGPFENKLLAAEIVALLLEWEEASTSENKDLLSTEERDLIMNFLVRQLLLLSETDNRSMKVDSGARELGETLKSLLGKVLRLRKSSGKIRALHFEKLATSDNQAKIDSSTLGTALDIISVISQSNNTMFLEENHTLINKILLSSFEKARTNKLFRSKLIHLGNHGSTTSKLGDTVAISVEKIMLESAQPNRRKPPNETSRSKQKETASKADLSYTVFGLEIATALCQKRTSFFSRIESSLLLLAGSLSKDHISEAVAKQRQGSSTAQKTTFTGILHHTPTKGITEEIFKKESYDTSRQSANRHKNTKGPESGDLHRCLALILSIFERQDTASTFSTNRKTLFQIFSTLMDHSDNVLLLMMCTRVVGKWLLSDNNEGLSPVITKERNSFLWKLSSFDLRCLANDVAAQALVDLVHHFVVRLQSTELIRSEDIRLVVGRSVVACLLNPDIKARKELLSNFICSADSGSPLSVLDLLWRLFHSDFEGIGGRYWIVVVVEAILGLATSADNGLVEALCILAHSNEDVCQSLFECVVPAAWGLQSNPTRARLARALEMLLSRSYHSQFLLCSPAADKSTMNTPRAFLNVVLQLRPIPVLDTHLLVTLAEKYNAWFEVLSLLEKQYQCAPEKPLGTQSLSAMRHCYRHLSEESIWMSLARSSCVAPKSRRAIQLDSCSFLTRAADAYIDLVELVESPECNIQPSEFEMDVWEERWVETQRQLCQLEVVSEFANTSVDHKLQLECAWRSQDWGKVRALCASSGLLVPGESGDATVKLCETLLAVADGKLSEVENLHAQSAQLCLYKWQLLPQLSSGSPVHASLFHFFHRLVEVRESGQIMVETSNHSDGRSLPDLKNLLNAWRGRLPNDYEPMTLWDEILSWRTTMYSAIQKTFHWSDPNQLASLHDRPWTAIRLAKTARKQGLRDVSLRLLSKASEKSTMNVLDAYLQLREQIIAYSNPDSEQERQGGLNLVNTTNLSFFDPSQRSELFRLKAVFLGSLGNRSKANQAFCHCVLISPSHSRAWVDWGNLCAVLGSVAEQQADKMTGGSAQRDRASTYKKVAQYLAQAIGCYMEAIRIDTHEWARLNIAKCLWMLSRDGSPGVLASTFENRGTLLPSWVWLPWLPQLLSGLYRPEGSGLKQLLSMVARSYPQAIYYPLRAFYLERRDVERARGASQSGSNQHMASVLHAEEMLSLLRRSHASLCSQLETILEELIVKFRPSTEEEFLSTIIALLDRVEGQNAGLRKSEEESMSQSCWKTLGRIAVKYFRQSESTARRDARAKQSASFKERYRKSFEEDFKVVAHEQKGEQPPTETFPLADLIVKIRGWRDKIQRELLSGPSTVRLVDVSRALAVYGMGDPPDLWPGACDPKYAPPQVLGEPEFNAESGAGQSTTSSSAAAARKAASNAANAAASAAKREGFGGDFGGSAAVIEIPGNYMPNGAWSDSRPSPELHPKIIRFQPTVDIIRRKENLVRRIKVLGDDGKNRSFVLQCALSYWTRTDERTSQTYYVVDKLMRKGVKTARAHLSVKPQPVVPVAQRLRLVLEPEHCSSLEQEFELSLLDSEMNREDMITRFNDELRQALSVKVYDKINDSARAKDEKESRLKIFNRISRDVSPSVLTNQILSFLRSTELFYKFKRTFAQQFAAECLFQYAFAIAERHPDNIVFYRDTGCVIANEARILYCNQGFMERINLPFRLTRNLSALIGYPLLEGHFLHTMSLIAGAIVDEKNSLDPIFHLLLRDDLVAFYTKSMAKSDSTTQEMDKQLKERIVKNTAEVQNRFALCSPDLSRESHLGGSPIDHHLRHLLETAERDEEISMMPAGYQGWI